VISRNIRRILAEIEGNIESMDMIKLLKDLDKLNRELLKVEGRQRYIINLIDMGNRDILRKEITDFDFVILRTNTELAGRILRYMKVIIEMKYPDETIYGRKIDIMRVKQKDLMDWYVWLKDILKEMVHYGS